MNSLHSLKLILMVKKNLLNLPFSKGDKTWYVEQPKITCSCYYCSVVVVIKEDLRDREVYSNKKEMV